MRWIRNSPVLCEVCGNARLSGFCCESHPPIAVLIPNVAPNDTEPGEPRGRPKKGSVGWEKVTEKLQRGQDMTNWVTRKMSPISLPIADVKKFRFFCSFAISVYNCCIHNRCVLSGLGRCSTGVLSDTNPSRCACLSLHVYTCSLCSQ